MGKDSSASALSRLIATANDATRNRYPWAAGGTGSSLRKMHSAQYNRGNRKAAARCSLLLASNAAAALLADSQNYAPRATTSPSIRGLHPGTMSAMEMFAAFARSSTNCADPQPDEGPARVTLPPPPIPYPGAS